MESEDTAMSEEEADEDACGQRKPTTIHPSHTYVYIITSFIFGFCYCSFVNSTCIFSTFLFISSLFSFVLYAMSFMLLQHNNVPN